MKIKRDYEKLAERVPGIEEALRKFLRGEIGRNRLYQITNRCLGLCIACNEARVTASLCERHRVARNKRHHKRVKAKLARDPEFKAKKRAANKRSEKRAIQKARDAIGAAPGEHRCSVCKERGHNAAGHWKHELKRGQQ